MNFGNESKVFIEPGIYLDVNVGVRAEGLRRTTFPQGGYSDLKGFRKGVSQSALNYGPSVGIGMKFPFLKKELMVKADYKLGLNDVVKYAGTVRNEYFKLMPGFRI